MTACEDVRVELGGYVLGGLTAQETDAVGDHVRTCARCRRELDELSALSTLLSLAGDASPVPSQDLRQRVLDAAPRRSSRRRWAIALAAAAALIGIVLGGAGALWLAQPPPAEPAVVLELRPGEGFDAHGRALVWPTPQTVRLELVIRDLEPLPDDGSYEAWLAPRAGWGQGDTPISIGAFHPVAEGSTDLTLWAEGPLDRYRSFWVTAEPDSVEGSHDGPTVVSARFPARR